MLVGEEMAALLDDGQASYVAIMLEVKVLRGVQAIERASLLGKKRGSNG